MFRYPFNKTRLTVFVLVLTTTVCAICAWGQQKAPPAAVVVTRVVEREVASEETFVGTVMPMRRSVVGCAVDGRVQKLYVDEGDPVRLESPGESKEVKEAADEKGQAVAQLRTKTINIQIAAAKAGKEILVNALEQLERSLPELLTQAKALSLSADAELKNAEANYERIKSLFTQRQAVSKSDLDQARSTYVAAQQAQISAASAFNELEQTRDVRIAQAQAKLLAQEEEVRRLEDLESKYTIRAPFNGYVVKKFAEVGQWVSSGDPVIEVIEIDPVEIVIAVPTAHIGHLNSDLHSENPNKVVVQIDGLGKKRFEGSVAKVIPQADTRTRAFPVKVRVPNPRGKNGHALNPGMLAKVFLAVGKEETAMLVPKDALVLGQHSPTVFVIVTDQETKATTVRPVSVKLGAAYGSLIGVHGQLQGNDQVVLVGNERLRPGQPVSIVKEVPSESQ